MNCNKKSCTCYLTLCSHTNKSFGVIQSFTRNAFLQNLQPNIQ